MNKTLKIIAIVLQLASFLAALASLSAMMDAGYRTSSAQEDAAKANVLTDLGRLQFDRAEGQERAASADEASGALAAGLSLIVFLLAAGVWLLADIAGHFPLRLAALQSQSGPPLKRAA